MSFFSAAKTGVDKITEVMDVFRDQIVKLEQGIVEVAEEKDKNVKEVEDQRAALAAKELENTRKNEILEASKKTAETLRNNIEKLLVDTD